MADVAFTGADIRVLPGVQPFRIKAGAAIPVGHAVYVAADGDVEQGDADAAASAQVVGIVVSAPNGVTTCADQDMLDIAGPGCRVTGFSGMTPGTLVYASVTAGRIADTRPAGASGDFAWIVGVALNATTILVMPFTDIFTAL
ncbi:MAG: hypothetical protein JXB07_18935 [Anaerolineae bacterium]|nr:hypothetical protein [Anaerolineae bacterium]